MNTASVQCTGTERHRHRLLLSDIKIEPRLQQRAVSKTVVDAYIERTKNGEKAPPVLVVWDGAETYWIVDGYHRLSAAWHLAHFEIDVDVRRGTFDDALLLAWGANYEHGYRRTRKQTKDAIVAALRHPVWSKLPDAELGRRLHVAHTTIGRTRQRLLNPPTAPAAPVPKSPEDTLELVLKLLGDLKTPNIVWTGAVVEKDGQRLLSLSGAFPSEDAV